MTVSEKLEQTVLSLINQQRTKRTLRPYDQDDVLARAARGHCQNMARLDFFDHESPVPNQVDVIARVIAAGGHDGNLGENLYWCRGLADTRVAPSVMAEWLSSAEHRDTMLSREYNKAGVGAFRRGKEFWVTLVCSDRPKYSGSFAAFRTRVTVPQKVLGGARGARSEDDSNSLGGSDHPREAAGRRGSLSHLWRAG